MSMTARWRMIGGALALVCIAGCMRGPEMAERRVRTMLSASTLAREQAAYLRAEQRSEDLERGMSVEDVERVMEEFIAVELHEGADGKPIEHRVALVEGRLCVRDVSERELRWVFGYDEGPVLFVGFVVVFTRPEAGDEWTVRQIDRQPADDCPAFGEG